MRTVLIVDDSETLRDQIQTMLGGDYHCITAEDGEEALVKVHRDRPFAVVADLEMPEMDGVELLRALRGNPDTSKIPVVIVTGQMNVQRVNACRSLGCEGFVLKPVSRDYLLAKLRRLEAVNTPPAVRR